MSEVSDIYMKITRHRAAIMAVIVAMVHDFGAVEDVFQDTVLEIIRHKDRFHSDKPFVPWARGVARNIVRRYYSAKSKNKVQDMTSLERLADIVAAEEPDEDVWEDERRWLRECMAQISEDHRHLIFLRYGRNLKGSRLADQWGHAEGAVRTTLFRIRQVLRKCIKGHLASAV